MTKMYPRDNNHNPVIVTAKTKCWNTNNHTHQSGANAAKQKAHNKKNNCRCRACRDKRFRTGNTSSKQKASVAPFLSLVQSTHVGTVHIRVERAAFHKLGVRALRLDGSLVDNHDLVGILYR